MLSLKKAKILSTEGGSRLVYSLGSDWVLKRLRKCWFQHNITELHVWEYWSNKPEGRYLAPVEKVERGKAVDRRISDSAYLIMERFSTTLGAYLDSLGMSWMDQLDYDPFIELQDIAESMSIWDIHPHNIGMRTNGSLVILDYGA